MQPSNAPPRRGMTRHVSNFTSEEIGKLFVEETAPLYRYALRLTGSAQEAEEAVARAALRAIEGADRFAGLSKARTWLFGILHNVVREMRREAWREESWGDMTLPPDSSFDASGHILPSVRDLGDDPDSVVLRAENVRLVREEVDRLPPLQRGAFHLRYFEELDSDEICNVLGVSDTHLRVLLHRARIHLRDRLVEKLAAGGVTRNRGGAP